MTSETVKERVFSIFKEKLQNVSQNFDRLALTKDKFDKQFEEKNKKIQSEIELEAKRKEFGGDYLLKEIVLKAPKSNIK